MTNLLSNHINTVVGSPDLLMSFGSLVIIVMGLSKIITLVTSSHFERILYSKNYRIFYNILIFITFIFTVIVMGSSLVPFFILIRIYNEIIVLIFSLLYLLVFIISLSIYNKLLTINKGNSLCKIIFFISASTSLYLASLVSYILYLELSNNFSLLSFCAALVVHIFFTMIFTFPTLKIYFDLSSFYKKSICYYIWIKNRKFYLLYPISNTEFLISSCPNDYESRVFRIVDRSFLIERDIFKTTINSVESKKRFSKLKTNLKKIRLRHEDCI